MTKIASLLAAGPTLSFEFGPPRTEEAEERLTKTLLELEPHDPSFVSVTYGALGTTRDTTRRRRSGARGSCLLYTSDAADEL